MPSDNRVHSGASNSTLAYPIRTPERWPSVPRECDRTARNIGSAAAPSSLTDEDRQIEPPPRTRLVRPKRDAGQELSVTNPMSGAGRCVIEPRRRLAAEARTPSQNTRQYRRSRAGGVSEHRCPARSCSPPTSGVSLHLRWRSRHCRTLHLAPFCAWLFGEKFEDYLPKVLPARFP